MYRKNNILYLAVIFIAVLIFSLLTVYAASATKKHLSSSSVSARAAVLYEPETQSFIFEKNADERLPMASTTKIMTALIAIENSSLDEIVEVDDCAIGTEGSSAYLKNGDALTMEELLYALMLSSANDAAVAIACHVGGDVEGFAALMNEKAESLGLCNTHFTNPHGLDDKEHYTTARELAIISACALENDTLREISSTYKKSFITEERSRTYINHNKLLNRYEDSIGLKTGFTKRSGRCLVGAAVRDGLRFITVTLDAPNDWNDHEQLFDLGYNTLEKINLSKCGDHSYSIGVIGGTEDRLTVSCKEEKAIILRKDENIIEEHIKLLPFTLAPINEGDTLGEVIFTLNGKEIERTPITADFSIAKKEKPGFWKRLASVFN